MRSIVYTCRMQWYRAEYASRTPMQAWSDLAAQSLICKSAQIQLVTMSFTRLKTKIIEHRLHDSEPQILEVSA
jgi:hypothetical protein